MRESTRLHFEQLGRLCAPEVNRSLLAALRSRVGADGVCVDKELIAANLARRAGDLAGARRSFEAHLGAPLPRDCAIPAGLFSGGVFAIAPIVAVDDFLSPDRMEALHRHACAIQPRFRAANVSSTIPAPDPEKRETLVTYEFEYLHGFFARFMDENFIRFADALGLPPFTVDRTEMKMTCYLDGGFFNAHADNHLAFGEAGRTLTWLYYFGETPIQYRGGELYILDTDFGAGTSSGTWATRIEPRPNRLIAFPSWFHHAVAPTVLPGGHFAHGRFAVGGHVRKTADGAKAWWE